MKKILVLLVSILFLTQCTEYRKESVAQRQALLGTPFRAYSDLEFLKGYTRISDTIIEAAVPEIKGPTHRLTHFKRNFEHLVIFSEVYLSWDGRNEEIRVPLDTLRIPALEEKEYITIGYCYNDKDFEQQIVAIVDSTEGDTIRNIKQVWKADLFKEVFMPVMDADGLTCFREY